MRLASIPVSRLHELGWVSDVIEIAADEPTGSDSGPRAGVVRRRGSVQLDG